MIIFSGLGLLIPVFYFAGMIPTIVLCTVLRMDFLKSFALSTWVGAAMVLLFAKTLGRPKERQLLDPQTGSYVRLLSKHTIFFMGGMVWAVIASVFALYLSILAVRSKKSFVLLDKHESANPAAALFIAADNRLAKADAANFGNTEAAQKLAVGISNALPAVQIMTPDDHGKKGPIGGRFVTCCQWSAEACAFLVHSPDLAKRTPEEIQVIKNATWAMAQMQCASLDPKPDRLAVAIRGATRYESIWIGVPAPLDPEVMEPGVKQKLSGSGKSALYPFFEPATGEPPKLADEKDQNSQTMSALRTKLREEAQAGSERKPVPTTPPTVPTPAAALPTEVRDWKSSDGRPLHAALLSVTSDAGVFRRPDGQEFTIPFVKFAPEDQTLLKTFAPAAK